MGKEEGGKGEEEICFVKEEREQQNASTSWRVHFSDLFGASQSA